MNLIKVKYAKQIFRSFGIQRVSTETYDLLDQLLTHIIQEISEAHSKLYPHTLLTPDTLSLILKEKGYDFDYTPTVAAFSEDEVEL